MLGPGEWPSGWPQEEWAARKPLPPDKKLIVRCRHCGQSATDPPNGLVWLGTHECSGVRPCSHCNGRGKVCSCALCKAVGCCSVCRGSVRMARVAPSAGDDLLTSLAKMTDEELMERALFLKDFGPDDHRELDKWLVCSELRLRGFIQAQPEQQKAGPGPLSCVYCGQVQESRVVYARHLDGCAGGAGLVLADASEPRMSR